MRYFASAILLFLLGAFSAFAQEQKSEADLPAPVAYEVIPSRSWVRFEVTQGDAIIRAEFKDYKIDALFHPKNVAASKIKVTIPLTSVSSASQDVVASVVKPDWWDSARFPQAVFESHEIITLAPNNYVAKGMLELRGVKKPVDLYFMYTALDERSAMVEGTTVLKRLDFGVGQGEWSSTKVVKDEVSVKFRLEAIKG